MNLEKLFQHDGEPCFMGLRRSFWVSQIFTLFSICAIMFIWFYGLWLIRTECFDKIEVLEKRLVACECVAKEE